MLEGWLRSLEERIDPVAQFEKYISHEIGRAAHADPWQVEALRSTALTLALRVFRQAGKSQVLATKIVNCLRRGGTAIALAPAERQSRLLTRHVMRNLRLEPELLIERSTLSEIELSTGGYLVAVPATGATIRGYSADLVVADEAAHFQDAEDVITAVLPMLKENGVFIAASTPAGRSNYFASLFLNPSPEVHRIVVRGTDVPRMAEKCTRLKAALSPTRYRQEVLVEMLSDGQSYFDIDAIQNAVSDRKALVL